MSFGNRHGRVHAKFPRLIRGCGDNTSITRLRANDDGPLSVLGMIALLATRVERIEIDMGDAGYFWELVSGHGPSILTSSAAPHQR